MKVCLNNKSNKKDKISANANQKMTELRNKKGKETKK